ncbi:MAG: amidohydrolase family protein [Acidobacteriota bacterium]
MRDSPLTPMRCFEADYIFYDGAFHPRAALLADPDGRIVTIGGREELSMPPGTSRRRYSGAMVPGAVNAHSHAFQILLRGRADAARNFRDWVDNYLYPLSLSLDGAGIEIGSGLAFAEMLKSGVTTVGEFFYLHNSPAAQGCTPLGDQNALRVIAAARRVGIRIHLLRCLYDRAERPGQERFYEPADDALAATELLRQATNGDAGVTVGIAPHSLHGASGEGIQAASDFAARHQQPFQIHLAEEQHDLDLARQLYGTSPGRALAALGVVSERLCLVHGVWLDAEEIANLGTAGAKCAYNPISNMALGDGVTDIPAMIEAGVTVALGCDGPGANHQVNVWQEMRFAEWLQRVTHLRMNVLQEAAEGRALTANYCFEMGTVNGGLALGLPVGQLRAGAWADFAVLDLNDPSLLPHHGPDPTALLCNVVNAMSARGAVRHVVVGGEEVVSDGRLTSVDEEEITGAAAAWRSRNP